MAETYRPSDKSIKPKDIIVGDLIMGHHEGDPSHSPLALYDGGYTTSPRGPYEVVLVLPKAVGSDQAGIYFRESNGTKKRYSDYDVRDCFWLIIRDRPGIPKFIAEYPDTCDRCKGKVYVGLNKVVHQRGGAERCP